MSSRGVRATLVALSASAVVMTPLMAQAAVPLDPPASFCTGTVGSDTRDAFGPTCNAGSDTVIGINWHTGSGVRVVVWSGTSPNRGTQYIGSSDIDGNVCLTFNGGQFWVEFAASSGVTKSVKKGQYFQASHVCRQ